jgi:hypothetical protein
VDGEENSHRRWKFLGEKEVFRNPSERPLEAFKFRSATKRKFLEDEN